MKTDQRNDDYRIEIPVDVDGVVYVFTGTQQQVDAAVAQFEEHGTPTYTTTRPLTEEDMDDITVPDRGQLSPAQSPEYRAALDAQQDYDSTREGQEALNTALATASTKEQARALRARQIAGINANRFRREQAAFMPPAIRRGQPGWREYAALADAREDLARAFAYAAAETAAWTKPSPATEDRLRELSQVVIDAEKALGLDTQAYTVHTLHSAQQKPAPWLGATMNDATEGDVAVLRLLGVDATWRNREKKVVAVGDVTAAWKWGYTTQPLGADYQVVQAPVIDAWYKAQAS